MKGRLRVLSAIVTLLSKIRFIKCSCCESECQNKKDLNKSTL